MQELALIPLITEAHGHQMRSAQPQSPVVPDPRPGRLRLATAGALRRVATRLDGQLLPRML
jgi:hypothetical protein